MSSSSSSGSSSSSSINSGSSVQVVVRLRPMNDKEKKEGTLPVISASTSNKSVTVIKGVGSKQARSQYSFDNVFTSFSNQQDVFSATLQPVISDVLKGFETCVFAYGQTGTGKTHTMEGDLNDPDQYGVIPRSAQAIFDALDSPQYVQTNVTCSYLEIYNEELSDLLVATTTAMMPSTPSKRNPSGSSTMVKLDIVHGGKKQGVHCRGLSEKAVHCADDVLKLMQSAAHARHVGQTRMNKQSSRSHCIFTMRVEATRTLPDGSSVLESQGKLHLVDLAGSESAKTAELKDSSASQQAARENERRNINKSLLTLGRVMSMLKEQSEGNNKKNKAMIPYRDSKLTRMLQEALGGRCKTVIIATISPSILNVQESLQTLHYAQTANGIKNKKAVSNSYMSVGSAAGGMQVEMMSSSGDKTVAVERWQEMEIRMEHMQQEVEEARQALARNYMQQQGLEERAEAAEKAKEEMKFELGKANNEIEALSNNLDTERKEKEAVTTQLRNTEVTLTKTATILKATQQTEHSLTSEALALLHSLKDSVLDGEKLYNMVRNSRDEEVTRRSATRDYHQSISIALNNAMSKLDNISSSEKDNFTQVEELVSNDHLKRTRAIEEAQSVVGKIASLVSETSAAINQDISSEMLPKLDSLATDVKSDLESAVELVVQGDEMLSSNCLKALAELKSFGAQLRDMDARYSKLKDESMSNVEKAMQESTSNVQTMVQSATLSLQTARDRSAETRGTLNKLIEEWRATGASTTTRVKKIISGQQRALECAFDTLESEMKRYSSVDDKLGFVKDLLVEGQGAQRFNFDAQNEKIRLQRRQLDEALESQESLCGQVMETVLSGVKDLVAQQLKLIVSNHSERTGKLLGCNTEILDLNDQLSEKSSTLFESLSSTNSQLQFHAEAMQQTDASVLTTLNEGHKALAVVDEVVGAFQVTNSQFEEQATRTTAAFTSIDDGIGDAQDKLTSTGEACVHQIGTSTQKIASESICQLGAAGSKALGFAQEDLVRQMSKAITNIEEPRKELVGQFSKNLQSIGNASQKRVVDVKAIATQSLETIATANANVHEKCNKFTSTRSRLHLSAADETRKQVLLVLKEHESGVQALTSACKENVKHSKGRTSSFGRDVIQMDAVIEELPHKRIINYSEDLSSTPVDADVLKGINLVPNISPSRSGTASPPTQEENIVSGEALPDPVICSGILKETSLNSLSGGRGKSDTNKIPPRKRSNDGKSRLPKRMKHKS